jgi:glycosyltransferase involved in cell wall biosynthesis
MAVGVPILATDSSAGVSECLLDGACGLIVPPNDCDAIATGIDRLFRDGHLRASLVATASARADAFDLVSAQQVYERILTDLIESRTS